MLTIQAEIIQRLNSLFVDNEWMTERCYLRRLVDNQPFVSANIITILEHCRLQDDTLLQNLIAARNGLKRYQKGHLTYHWPLIEGKSRMPNARFLGRLDALVISPDADCSCLQQIALQEHEMIPKVAEELIFYRLDNRRFRLPGFQAVLPETEGSYLTWFPPKSQCHSRKLETIDVAVDANILWFLGKFDMLDLPGCAETVNFLRAVLQTDLIRTAPYKLSQYYPYPAIILYLISRAIVWGKLKLLQDERTRILALADSVKPHSFLDRMSLAAVGCLWEEPALMEKYCFRYEPREMRQSPFYVWPIIAAPVQYWAPLETVARQGWTHMTFISEAFQLALMLWLLQEQPDLLIG